MDDYFPSAAFFKPTGDGLMVILDHPDNAEDARTAINGAVQTALNLVTQFASIADDDILVNFATPQDLGIGIARGSVTRLHSGDVTLDYSGRCLNLAARLMDLARPRGVVFQDRFAPQFLAGLEDVSFEEHDVYLKGVTADVPLRIYSTGAWTQIQASAKRRTVEPTLVFDPEKRVLYRALRDGAPVRTIVLEGKVADASSVAVYIKYSRRSESTTRSFEVPAALKLTPDGECAVLNVAPILDRLKSARVLLDTEVALQAKYLAWPADGSS